MVCAAFKGVEDDPQAVGRLLRYAQDRWGVAANLDEMIETPGPDPEDVRTMTGAH